MYYSTLPQIERIFEARRQKQFFVIPLVAINNNIDCSDVSNHTIRQWAEKWGKIYTIEQFEQAFNSGILSKSNYYIRVF